MAKGKKTGGRQKGAQNKLTGDVKAMVLAALDKAGGTEYLAKQALLSPSAFLSLVGKLLPMTVAGDADKPTGLTITVKRAGTEKKS